MPRLSRTIALVLALLLPLNACAPAFRPRAVPVPAECEEILRRAAERGPEAVAADEAEFRRVSYCQQQRSLRADEEQAAQARQQAQATRIGFWVGVASTALWLIVLSIDRPANW